MQIIIHKRPIPIQALRAGGGGLIIHQGLIIPGAYERREGAFNCTYRAATASSKVIRHSMSILGLSAGYVIRRAAHTIEVLAIYSVPHYKRETFTF